MITLLNSFFKVYLFLIVIASHSCLVPVHTRHRQVFKKGKTGIVTPSLLPLPLLRQVVQSHMQFL